MSTSIVRQKDIRAALRNGVAQPLANAVEMIESGARVARDFERVSLSIGVYGKNGGMVEDTRTGQLYADACRSTHLFYFFD